MSADATGGLRVVDAGVLTTIQDLGRRAVAEMGISPAGAADWLSARAANRLAGNNENAALIEITMTAAKFELLCDARIAVTGADAPLEIGGCAASAWCARNVCAGEHVKIGAAQRGLRSYLAVHGGIAVAPVFGSASTDVGAGFGGCRLKTGDVLQVNVPAGIYSGGPRTCFAARDYLYARKNSHGYLRALLGPDADTMIVDELLKRTFRVSHQSNRQALRLEAEAIPLARRREIVSAGVCAGCVQVTPDGLPIVMLAEHQTTGGYASVLCVCTADLPRAAQLRPGDAVRFKLVSQVEGSLALREAVATLSGPEHAGIR